MNYMSENVGNESFLIETKTEQLQVLENISMYTNGAFESFNYQPEDSGLPLGIWFDDAGKARKNKHSEPRVKIIMSSGNLIPVSIEEKPRILLKGTRLTKAEKEFTSKYQKPMFSFISHNHKLILQHWNGEISALVLGNNLKKPIMS